ncbi:MAG: sigma-70 family RNA polymerase sigma factor [Kiritimatiellales bacterium]|nr:sigma-70 family RNA polymerase sigma factor [Kiritimatiellales bacterium]
MENFDYSVAEIDEGILDPQELYRSEVCSVPLMTDEEHLQPTAGNPEVQARFIEAYLRFGRSIALQYQNRGLSEEDLIQTANMAIVRRMQEGSYDPKIGSVQTYLEPSIRQAIQVALRNEHVQRKGTTIRSKRVADAWKMAESEMNNATDVYSEKDIASELGYKADHAATMKSLLISRLRGLSKRESLEHCTNLEMPADELIIAEEQQRVHNAIAHLDQRLRIVIKGLYIDDMTEIELAEMLNVNRSYIGQLKTRALGQLAVLLNTNNIEVASEKIRPKNPPLTFAQAVRRKMLSCVPDKHRSKLPITDDDLRSLNQLLLLALAQFDTSLNDQEQKIIRAYYLNQNKEESISMRILAEQFDTTPRRLNIIRDSAIKKLAMAISDAFTQAA